MTVIEATRALFEFFKDNDVFNMDKDFQKVVLITLDDKLDQAIVRVALKDFEERGLITALSNDGSDSEHTINWVLNKPLVEYNQTIELSFGTIHAITSTINQICDDLELEKGKVNPMQVTEQDIQNLVLIVHNLREEIAEQEDEE